MPASTITAKITARAARSTVPGNAGAVDATVYVDGRDLVVGDVVEIHTADDERPDPGALDYYVAVRVTVAGVEHRVGVCVGARESDHGSVRASGAGVKPYCTAWWVDPSDHASLPAGWRDAVEDALQGVSYRLYREASEKAGA